MSLFESIHDDDLKADERQGDLFIRYGETDIETLNIVAPKGYVLDERPADELLRSDAFTFSLKITPTKKGARVVRRLDLQRGRFPRRDYDVLRRPFRRFAEVRQLLLVFRKKP